MTRLALALQLSFLLSCQAKTQPGRVIDFPELPQLAGDNGPVRFTNGQPVQEGGWSALARDPRDPSGQTFWCINDRGLNIPLDSRDGKSKVFPHPAYHQKILRLQLRNGHLRLIGIDSLGGLTTGSGHTLGLPSSLFPNGEIALPADPRTGQADTLHPLVPSPEGYDFEGLRLGQDKGWLSEEYGPSLLEFDRNSLRLTRRWSPGQGLPPVYATRRLNHGLEGLALTPSGKLVALMQSPLWNWIGKRKDTRDTRIVRMLELDPTSGRVREFALPTDPRRAGRHAKFGDLVALDEHRFLAVEHGKLEDGSLSFDLWLLDLTQASDVSSPLPNGMRFREGRKTLEELMDVRGLEREGVVPVRKTLIRARLEEGFGWNVSRPEGLEVLDDTTVALLHDNDYGLDRDEEQGSDGLARQRPGPAGRSSMLLLPVPSLKALLRAR